jgi:hypothetical protein
MYEGLAIEIKKSIVIDHPGILVRNGTNWAVVHNSPATGGVVLSTLEEFSNGKKIYAPKRYKSRLHPYIIAQRARQRIGMKWTPLYNCQHFVNDACGLQVKSHDLNFIGFGTIFLLASVAFRR